MGAFEDFVNLELPKRISTDEDGAGTGNLPMGLYLRTTGIGLGVIPVAGTSGGPMFTTLLTVVGYMPPGAEFFVNSGGIHYVKEKDDGFLGSSSAEFGANENIQIFLNGSNMVKVDHVQWTSSVSFIFGFSVDAGDFIKIIS